MRIEKLREEWEKAQQKAELWQARAKDLEKRVTEQENLEIIQAVRNISASPDELKKIIERISLMKEPVEVNVFKEKAEQHEDEG